MGTNAIQVDGLWKKFRKGEMHDSLREFLPALLQRMLGWGTPADELGTREFWALRDVAFQLEHGQSLGVIGPNGAGKSTLFKVLSRILRPDRGSYRIDGRLSSLIEVGAGFHQDLTGRENIYLSGIIRGMRRVEIKARESEIIAFAEIEDFIDTPVKRYSSGMLARLGFSVAAHMRPDILLVDEVLSVGDARFRDKCVRHMQNLLTSGLTVVFISHILDQVRSLCPRTLVLDHGQAVFDGPTDSAIHTYLELLANHAPAGAAGSTPVEIRNIRFTDAQGREVLQWPVARPAAVAFDLVVHTPVDECALIINFHSLAGVYLGTVGSHQSNLLLSTTPGTYPVRFVLEPNPLAEGDYALEFKVNRRADGQCLWASLQSRTLSVRGQGRSAGLVRLEGHWELLETPQPRISSASTSS